MNIIFWKKNYLSNTYRLFTSYKNIGYLSFKFISTKAVGDINGKKILIKKISFWRPEFEIIDLEAEKVGSIIFSLWGSKATIIIKDEINYWKYNNFWQTKWEVIGSTGNVFNYNGSSYRGTIIYKNDNDLLLISGLWLAEYSWRMQLTATFTTLILLFLIIS